MTPDEARPPRAVPGGLEGKRRLMTSPLDLAPCTPFLGIPPGPVRGTERHRQLLESYASDLRKALAKGESWWSGKIASQERRHHDRARAERIVTEGTPGGPASHPEVLFVLRRFWLAVDELNQSGSPEDRVPPWVFLLEWLEASGRQSDAARLYELPYWPIGLDGDGRWV
jgi:hypothetical protein